MKTTGCDFSIVEFHSIMASPEIFIFSQKLGASTNALSKQLGEVEHVHSRTNQSRKVETPRHVRHFTLSYGEWHLFFDSKAGEVTSSWSDQLAEYLPRAGITCTVVFKKHYNRKKESRKKNCNLFTCKGQCALQTCPVHLTIVVEKEPKNKESPSIFTVYIFGVVNHQSDIDSASRHLREPQRSVMGMFLLTFKPVSQRVFAAQHVNRLGPLAAYERNVRLADENLLQEGNLTQVPSIDVLKTAGQEYNKKYRLDEDMFMEVRIFRELTERLDTSSVKVKGK